jgi:acyl-[acyl-carrier-protein] desaturase
MKHTNHKLIEDALFENYLRYFKTTEERRRWNVWKDFEWNKANRAAGEDVAQIVEAFSSIEMFLPDYTAKILELVRKSRGRAWFQANWGYEESKHSLVLAEWLVRSGYRSASGLHEYENDLLERGEWELPFDTPSQMIVYTMIQERATQLNYVNLRGVAAGRGDTLLDAILRRVAADEAAHFDFFRRGVSVFLQHARNQTLDDLKFVFRNFKMPALSLVPDWEAREKTIRRLGVYGAREYLLDVYLPILADLRLSPDELAYLGAPSRAVEAAAERQEKSLATRKVYSIPNGF